MANTSFQPPPTLTGFIMFALNRFRIKTVLTLGLALLLGLIVLAAGLVHQSLQPIQQHWDHFANINLKKQQLLLDFKQDIGYGGAIHNFKNYLLRGDSAYYINFQRNVLSLHEHLNQYRQIKDLSASELKSLTTLENTVQLYESNIQRVRSGLGNADKVQLDAEVRIDDQAALAAFRQLEQAIHQAVKTDTRRIDLRLENIEFRVVLISLIVGLSVVALSIALISYITGRLKRMTHTLEQAFSLNDLSIRFNERGGDEVAKLAHTVDAFLEKIEQLVLNLVNSIHSINTLTHQQSLKFSNTALSIRATHEEASTIVNHTYNLTDSIQRVTAAVEMSNSRTSQADEAVRRSSDYMSATITSTEKLKHGIDATVGEIKQLDAESERIISVLSLIREISDQTNLLALNAAIEAARAGEHGRGFAVVADEVRTLASKTKDATDQINEMIASLQSKVKASVQLMENSEQAVDASTKLASETSVELAKVTQDIATISQETADIAQLILQQNSSVAEVARNINNMKATAENTVMLAEDNGKNTDQIKLKMLVLENHAKQFKIRKLEATSREQDDNNANKALDDMLF